MHRALSPITCSLRHSSLFRNANFTKFKATVITHHGSRLGAATARWTRSCSMASPRDEYFYVEDVELLSNYCPGGYRPTQINEVLVDRYRIVHKLGHGSFSTTWLAIDEQKSNYVAVKVGTADAGYIETDILTQLRKGINSQLEFPDRVAFIPILLDQFTLQGSNGSHPCFVTFPARCSLRATQEATWSYLFPLEVARSFAAQLAMTLSFVHEQGYAHGDLHLGNLLLCLPSSLDELTRDQLYTKYGAPEQEPVLRVDTKAPSTDPGVPLYVVPPIWLGIPCDQITLTKARLMLNDFGVAFRPSERLRLESYTPIVLRPPEAFFEPKTPLTFASDIWSLGCVIFELLAHRSLIDGFLAPPDEITAQQVQLQGMMPPEWWAKWEKRSKWYDEAGKPLSKPSDLWPWERRIEEYIQVPRRKEKLETLSDKEQTALLNLLQSMLAWKPDDRPDINHILKSGWMTNWALPAYRQGTDKSST